MSTTTPEEDETWSLEALRKSIIDSAKDYHRIIEDMKETDEEPST